ncbi:MAG: tRNA (adenosine(37)-N6)-threonylcarbamoyltransferase complex dimerization subunit type 1 TsaB [Oscillospiraceae bacterium]|jgi:tRNA threonylcarbamoyladenosine biosynthesis protein TsaB|nr:tRNA (adenosine(37)-N6)-threonylcarbamoyltransferase complex dimerization subunit type 1 TsaB [Oscillospiraceae bacterium]
MITLGVDSASQSASAALVRAGALLGECFACTARKHSAVLLPMIEQLFAQTGLGLEQVDRFAVTNGPGSFTGVRIGVSLVKGLAQARGKPCAGVSTLKALAYPAADREGLLCCALDARRGQVYAAVFAVRHGGVQRLCPDEALATDALEQRLLSLGGGEQPVTFLGDGAALCLAAMRPNAAWSLASPLLCAPRGYGAALAAGEADYHDAAALGAVYLRLSQAERLREERLTALEGTSAQ